MKKRFLLYPVGETPAVEYAAHYLKGYGIAITDHPSPEVTHLILDVPSFRHGISDTLRILDTLPQDITLIGGKLSHPSLENYPKMDLLEDPVYQAINAGITAHCTVRVAMERLKRTMDGLPVLIIGWGRIGKCLGRLLRNMGALVTVSARNPADQAMLQALGFGSMNPAVEKKELTPYRLIINTVPASTLATHDLEQCGQCLKLDLASERALPGEDVIWARGLPGTYAPESSGMLIADRVFHFLKERT